MKRPYSLILTMFGTVALCAVGIHSASAAALNPRIPQAPVAGGTLQGYLSGPTVLESINVSTDQEHTPRWRTTISGNSAITLQIEMAGNLGNNSLGVYNANGPAIPLLYEIFPASADTGYFVVPSFRPLTSKLIVNRFLENGSPDGSITYEGVNTADFGYYISGPGGIGYSQDQRQAGGNEPRVLVFSGTGINKGNWWLCFEDNDAADPDENSDYDDAILFVESINPTAVARTSWGALKSRFR